VRWRGEANYYLAGADPRKPHASPLYADPTGLPPTLIQVGSDEILLDDSLRMAERMRAAGCQVELEIWPRMPHTWVLPEARAAIERIGAFVQSKLEPQAMRRMVAPGHCLNYRLLALRAAISRPAR
jgi:acetyl esterase/lipase